MKRQFALLLTAVAFVPGVVLRARPQTPDAPAFEVAVVQPSKPAASRGARSGIAIDPGRLSAQGVSLKQLIHEAYNLPYSQISGGPAWLDSDEYDIDAKAESATTGGQMRLMLRTLLADRFKLAVHTDSKEKRVYTLTVYKGHPLIRPLKEGDNTPPARFVQGVAHYRGDMAGFADLVAFRITTPILEDPSTPSFSNGPIVPVLDRTGLKGMYEIDIEVKREPEGDAFTAWQRALQLQLGLKLEAVRAPVSILFIDHAEKIAPSK